LKVLAGKSTERWVLHDLAEFQISPSPKKDRDKSRKDLKNEELQPLPHASGGMVLSDKLKKGAERSTHTDTTLLPPPPSL
jgi:hypothetical protein